MRKWKLPDNHRNHIQRKRFFCGKGLLRCIVAGSHRHFMRCMWKRQTNPLYHILGMPRLRKKIQSMRNYDDKWVRSMEWARKYCGCHQMPERSFFVKEYQFPLCARCTGILIGHILALCAAPFYTFSYFIAWMAFPLAIDGTIQYCFDYESNNTKRILSGILYGFAFTSILCRFIKGVFQKFK